MSSVSAITAVPRVLVVEDEAMLRASVVEGLKRLPGISVAGAASVASALREIDAGAPALIISDIDLPDRSGLELLGELGARGLKPHLVFVSAYVKAYRAQIPTYAGVEVLEKPVTLEQLRGLVTQRLQQAAPAASPFTMTDYLQLASLGHHSVSIEVEGEGLLGRVLVMQGQAWTAEDQSSSGMAAFRHLAQAQDVRIRCQAFSGEPGARTLQGSVEALLLESARLADEAAHRKAPPPPARASAPAPSMAARSAPPAPLPARPSPAPLASRPSPAPLLDPRTAVAFTSAFERGVEASLARQHKDALEAFREAARLNPADLKTQANIRRLEELLETRPEPTG